MDAVSRTPGRLTSRSGSTSRAATSGPCWKARSRNSPASETELTMTIDGHQQMAAGEQIDVVQPHNKAHVLGQLGNATNVDVAAAIYAAKQAAPGLAGA